MGLWEGVGSVIKNNLSDFGGDPYSYMCTCNPLHV